MKGKLLMMTLLVSLSLAAPLRAEKPTAAAPNGSLIYLGTWPDKVLVFDPAQEKIVDTIKLATGTPFDIFPSEDRTKLYVVTTKMTIETVDLATRKVTDHFDLAGPDHRVFPMEGAIDPKGRYLYLTLRSATKEIDRFKIEKTKFLVFDLAEKKVTKTFDFPKEFDQGFGFLAECKISPDGKLLYVFKEDILIFDLATFKQIDKIELSKPLSPGSYPISLRGSGGDPNEEPGFVTSIFNATDEVTRRSIFGIARIDLQSKKVDFSPIGPSAPMNRFLLSPDRKTGYTVVYNGQGSTRRTEFWVFDVPGRKLLKKLEFEARTRFSFGLSADGKQFYIYAAGPTIDVYDAANLNLKKTITLDGDIITQMVVLRPPAAPSR